MLEAPGEGKPPRVERNERGTPQGGVLGGDNVTGICNPSHKARLRERQALRQLIHPSQSHTPLPELIERLNRHLRGWANYFGLGYPRQAFFGNHFVRPGWVNTCACAANAVGVLNEGLASSLTWNTWDWLYCERFLE